MNTRGQWRIVHLITRLDVGGSAENTLLTIIGQAKAGHKVTLICGPSDNPASSNESTAAKLGVTIIKSKNLVRHVSPAKDMAELLSLCRHFAKHKYDIVHTHTSKAGILGRLAAWLMRGGRIVHTPHGHIFEGYFSKALTRVFVFAEWLLTKVTDCQITLTQNEKSDYLAKGIGTERKLVPVFSGIDIKPFARSARQREDVRKELGLEKNDFVVGCVARLVTVKNHAQIIDAAAQLKAGFPKLRYVFVGDGDLRGELELLARERDVHDKIVFAGWRPDIVNSLGAFDAFAMTSLNEGMGRAFVEAQAAGLPVIGTRVGGVPEVLQEGKTGFLVACGDVDGLANAIRTLYEDPQLAHAMGDRARRWVDPQFSVGVMVEKINGIYAKVLEERPL